MAFGQPMTFYYRLDQAKVILSLGSDFLCSAPEGVRYARDFATRRRAKEDPSEMNRLYVVESSPSPTGTMADHRLPLKPSELEQFARALAARVTGGGGGGAAKQGVNTANGWTPWLGI